MTRDRDGFKESNSHRTSKDGMLGRGMIMHIRKGHSTDTHKMKIDADFLEFASYLLVFDNPTIPCFTNRDQLLTVTILPLNAVVYFSATVILQSTIY